VGRPDGGGQRRRREQRQSDVVGAAETVRDGQWRSGCSAPDRADHRNCHRLCKKPHTADFDYCHGQHRYNHPERERVYRDRAGKDDQAGEI
jgi:hypothetical protein